MSRLHLLEPHALDERALRVIPWIVAIAFFMQMLDTSILNTALPSIADSLQQSPLAMHWVVIAYMLTVAVLMPISGWVADRFGTRTILLAAIVLFSAGSLLCAFSYSLHFLIGARIIQGVGGAFLMPVGRLAILRIYPRHNLVQVLSFISIPALVGPLLGPAVGGFLTEYASWHWIFLINLPVGLLGCIAVLYFFPELKQERTVFDLCGFFLFGAAMLMISFSLDGWGHGRLSQPLVAALGVGGFLCIALYIVHARRHVAPLFRLRIFRIRSFSVGLAGNILARFASGGMPYLTPLLLQVVMGYQPFTAGLALIPMTVSAIFSKAVATRLLNRFGYRRVLVVNTILLGALITGFSLFTPHTPLWVLLLVFVLFGAVNSLQFTAMNTLALIELPQNEASSGNSLLSVITQLSLSLGVAVAATCLALYSSGESTLVGPAASDTLRQAFRATYLTIGSLSIFAAAVFAFTPKSLGKGMVRGSGR